MEKNKSIIEELVFGSSEIDRMRSEIDQVLKMMVGLLKKAYPHQRYIFGKLCEKSFTFKISDGLYWDLYPGSESEGSVIDLKAILHGQPKIFYTTNHNGYVIPTKDVRVVFTKALPILVESIVSKFPKVEEAMKPILEVSNI